MKATRRLLPTLLAGGLWILFTAASDPMNLPSAIPSAAAASPRDNGTPLALPFEREFPPLAGATAWLNSPPLSAAGLRGKVVLIDFWTYSCINWRRTAPYLRAWAEKYGKDGLVVIGVHSPEFGFEKSVDNVRAATDALKLEYPIAVDSELAIWRSFANEYWPAIYLIDAKGRARHHRFGEGDYEGSERVIQQLLSEAGVSGVATDLVSVAGAGAEFAPDLRNLRSTETYSAMRARRASRPAAESSETNRTCTRCRPRCR